MPKKTYRCAEDAAVAYIERRQRTCGEVKNKLLEYGFSLSEIEGAITLMKESLLLNDEEYAAEYVQSKLAVRPMSVRGLKAGLRKHLLPDYIIENVLSSIEDNSDYENAYDEAKAFFLRITDFEDKNKLIAKISRRLMSHGYSYDVIRQAVNRAYLEACEACDE